MLKAFDGLDHYDDADDMQARAGFLQYAVPSANNALTFVTGSNGAGKAARFTTANNVRCCTIHFGEDNATAFFGCKLRLSHGAEFQVRDSFAATTQCAVLFDPADKSIALFRGDSTGTLLFRTDANAWVVNTWFMFELMATISNTLGSLLTRINGVGKAGSVGVDTQTTGSALWSALRVLAQHGGVGNSTVDIDDAYYLDTVAGPGPYPMNTFIGSARVETLFANGNDAVQFTPLSGTNYQMIDEQAMDADTTYNSSATYLHKDSFNFGALSVTAASIFGVQLTTAARKDNAGLLYIQQFLKQGGTEFPSAADLVLSDTYQYYSEVWAFDEYTSKPWSVSAVNSLSAGYLHNTPTGYGMSYGTFYG
jgi:hypothetical protein